MYEEPGPSDGVRVLVDRLWPRGMSHERADWDGWVKGVAPSAELRRWYGHDPERYREFVRRYEAELDDEGHRRALEELRRLADDGPVTLLTATRDLEHAHTKVLARLLREGWES